LTLVKSCFETREDKGVRESIPHIGMNKHWARNEGKLLPMASFIHRKVIHQINSLGIFSRACPQNTMDFAKKF